ncbi:MAG: acyl-CoA desaturase [Myxococcota bacterium]
MTDAPYTNPDPKLDRIAWRASVPFFLMHALVGLAFVTGFKWEWALLALVSYYVRMFGVTAGYHRYFGHRAYKTNRVFQFFLAFLAQTSVQKGALWWAAHHRHHHRFSDQPEDIHSPVRRGFWWSHVGWILARRYDATNYDAIKDFSRFPELVWLNEFWLVPPAIAAGALYAIGGLPWLVWGMIIPTVFLWHGTFTINSLTHVFGKRRYLTTDTSRNNFLLALITCGEGWHNNHHYHQNTANQGWFWWEIDPTFYVLKVLSWFGVVSDLRLPRPETKYAFRKYTEEQRQQLKAESRFGMYLPRPIVPTPTPPPMPTLGPGSALATRS